MKYFKKKKKIQSDEPSGSAAASGPDAGTEPSKNPEEPLAEPRAPPVDSPVAKADKVIKCSINQYPYD